MTPRVGYFLLGLLACSCSRLSHERLPQRGYLWQRHWNTAVSDGFAEAQTQLDGVVLLGGEIVLENEAPRFIKAKIDWPLVGAAEKPSALALRVEPFRPNESAVDFIAEAARTLVRDATAAKVTEFQLDYDCPQSQLAAYAGWLPRVREAVRPLPLVITTLPAWIGVADFSRCLREVDSYVLQVHSVPLRDSGEHLAICDRKTALRWIARAAKYEKPFSVALPTYRCVAGYDPTGKLLGVAMDSVQPSWPAGTRLLEAGADADEISRLVAELQREHAPNMRGLIWYRLPVASDQRNWHWPTLRAVMQGRAPVHAVEFSHHGVNPVDVSVINRGEAEEQLTGSVTVSWREGNLIAADALAGWVVSTDEHHATFAPEPGRAPRLLPSEQRDIGWLRYDRTPAPSLELSQPELRSPRR